MREVTAIPGVTGCENQAAAYIAEAFRPLADEVTVTPLNCVVAHRKRPGPKALICAHLDEIGMMVSKIEKDGCLRMQSVGGVNPRILPGMRVRVYGKNGLLPGVVGDIVCFEARYVELKNGPVANYRGELYSLPFNMYIFNKMQSVVTPEEAPAKIEEQRKAAGITELKNLEEQAISLVGTDIYEKLVKGYTEKQWGRDCKNVSRSCKRFGTLNCHLLYHKSRESPEKFSRKAKFPVRGIYIDKGFGVQ